MTTVRSVNGLVMVDLDDLEPSPSNPRTRYHDIDELAQSIYEVGMIQPIVAQRLAGQDKLRIVAGHRRYAAAKRIRMREVPVVLRREMLPDAELLTMLIENGQRAGLDPIEEAHAMQRLKGQGLTEPEISRKIGRSLYYVTSRLVLLTLTSDEQEDIRVGYSTLTHAADLIKKRRREERERLNPIARPVGRPKGSKTKPYFGDTHPLAVSARALCAANGHGKGHVKVGKIACGPCWELAIRADAQKTLHAPAEEVA